MFSNSLHPKAPFLYERSEKVVDSKRDPDKVFLRIMQWNVLADRLAHKFPKVPQEYLEKEYRVPLIVKEMQQAGLPLKSGEPTPTALPTLPDMIVCQEMDMQDEILGRLNALDEETHAKVTLNSLIRV